MPDIDLYHAHRLDRGRSSADLAAALTAELNATSPRDTVSRNRIETARAILGDPARRARYDAALADPNAPTLDEAALAAIAGRPAPIQRSGLAAAFATTQARVLAGVVAVLALVLVVVIAVVATSGGGDADKSTTAANGESSSSPDPGDSDEDFSCTIIKNTAKQIANAEWSRAATNNQPTRVAVITDAIELPASMSGLATETQFGGGSVFLSGLPYNGLTQFQDKNIGALVRGEILSLISPDGRVLSTTTYTRDTADRAPKRFDLARNRTSGYYRIEAQQGIEMPTTANGTEKNMVYATSYLADAFDDSIIWLTLRGSSMVYKASFYGSQGWTELGAAAAPLVSKCKK